MARQASFETLEFFDRLDQAADNRKENHEQQRHGGRIELQSKHRSRDDFHEKDERQSQPSDPEIYVHMTVVSQMLLGLMPKQSRFSVF